MTTNHRLTVNECIWIRSGVSDEQYIFRSIRNALFERGIMVLTLNGPRDSEGMARIRKAVWDSDAQVMLDVMMADELKALYPVFKDRETFFDGAGGLVEKPFLVHPKCRVFDLSELQRYCDPARVGEFCGESKATVALPPRKYKSVSMHQRRLEDCRPWSRHPSWKFGNGGNGSRNAFRPDECFIFHSPLRQSMCR